MTRRYPPIMGDEEWDNASVESLFSTLNRELDDRVFAMRDEARAVIFGYIEIWYNWQRRR